MEEGIFPNSFKHLTQTSALLGILLVSPVLQAATLQEQRDLFKQAYSDLQDGDADKAKPVLPFLRDYPLYPWLEYELLEQGIKHAADQDLQEFAERYPNSLMSDRIYRRWAKRLAGTNDWNTLLKYIPGDTKLTSLQCLRAEALTLTGELESGLQQGMVVWNDTPGALPGECNGLLEILTRNNQLTERDYWKRIGKMIEKNQITKAKQLAKRLPEKEQELVDLWAKVRKSPKKYLPRAFKQDNSAKLREIIVFGVIRAADKKLSTAKPLWEKALETFNFTPAEKGRVESSIGMWEAWRHDQKGLQRLKDIPGKHRSDTGNVWMARMALRTGEWDTLIDAVENMEAEESERDIWRYWHGRALEQAGKQTKANSIFSDLAGDTTFYGFMAADRLGQDYKRLQQPPPDRSQRIAGIKKIAAIQRWQEWMAIGKPAQARKEWFRTLKVMDKEGMLAAAALAMTQGDANLAIWTVSRTKEWNNVDVRFPVLYTDLVMEHSKQQGIRPEWILGVMRRESAFKEDAESHAKALGLMQLMPATARNVGKKLGMKVSGKQEILQPATNVQLGSAYLSSMLGRFKGNYAQATAAYNAGPHRISKWAPKKTIAPDQWVESIPFKETRRYVRAVMAYTTIYDHKLNAEKAGRLSMRLKPIGP